MVAYSVGFLSDSYLSYDFQLRKNSFQLNAGGRRELPRHDFTLLIPRISSPDVRAFGSNLRSRVSLMSLKYKSDHGLRNSNRYCVAASRKPPRPLN